MHIWNGMVKGFSKMYNFLFFGQIFFANIFTILLDFAIKTSIFCKFANFFADSKCRAQELSNDVSFVIFGHQTWDLEGGGSNWPPQHILVFKYPSRDRVKTNRWKQNLRWFNTFVLFIFTSAVLGWTTNVCWKVFKIVFINSGYSGYSGSSGSHASIVLQT